MTKAHAKDAPQTTAQPQAATPAATAADAPAAVVCAPATAATAADEHAGHGGLYTVIDGQRTLTDRTASSKDQP